MRAAMKPLPTLMKPLRSVDLETGEAGEALVERSDVAAVEALAVVAEAAVAFELARAAREKFGGDALGDFVARLAGVPGAHPVAARARPPPRARRLHGRGQDDARRGGRASGSAREFVDLDRDDRAVAASADPEHLRRRAARTRSARVEADACSRRSADGRRCRRSAAARSRRPRCARSCASTRSPSCSTSTSRRRGRGSRGTDRPLARGRGEFRALYERGTRRSTPRSRTRRADDADGVVLAAAGVDVETGALARLAELVPATGRSRSSPTRTSRASTAPTRSCAAPLAARTRCRPARRRRRSAVVERLWRELRLGRDGTIVALGGGCTTDVAGFAAATYLRGIAWVPCRRRSSARSTRRSAARRRSTCRRARTSSAPSTGRRGR